MSDQDVDWDSDEPIVESLMNRIAEMERLWVKVWEDCPMNGTQDGEFWCDDGCDFCGGSGKVPAEGVEDTQFSHNDYDGWQETTEGTHVLIPIEWVWDVGQRSKWRWVEVSDDE